MLFKSSRYCVKAVFARNYSTTISPPRLATSAHKLAVAKDIVIVGGGITGLVCAYFCAIAYPTAKITLYESSKRFGGWIRSSKHERPGGHVIFEHGPRSLRPHSGTLALIGALGLEEKLLLTPKTAPAAKNRFIWNNDQLVNVGTGPDPRNPVWRKVIRELWRTRGVFYRPVTPEKDETVGELFRRRECSYLGDHLISAMLHGIYAGDIDKLSAFSVLPGLVFFETRFASPYGWLVQKIKATIGLEPEASLEDQSKRDMNDHFAFPVIAQMERASDAMKSSVYTLKGGLETLVTTLTETLQANPQVKLITEASIQQIDASGLNNPDGLRLTVKSEQSGSHPRKHHDCDFLISTISSTSLAKLCDPIREIWADCPAATTCVVNLFYEKPDLLPIKGFGFLLPKTVPTCRNPEGALGVVFDSDATPELDTVKGTKLTVMLGGPFWADFRDEHLPSNDEAIGMAKAVVQHHLGISDEPVLTHAELHKNCIPQYHGGHSNRMAQGNSRMSNPTLPGFWNRVKVAGSWYNGVGVNNCIQSAFTTSTLLEDSTMGNEYSWQPYKWHGGDKHVRVPWQSEL